VINQKSSIHPPCCRNTLLSSWSHFCSSYSHLWSFYHVSVDLFDFLANVYVQWFLDLGAISITLLLSSNPKEIWCVQVWLIKGDTKNPFIMYC